MKLFSDKSGGNKKKASKKTSAAAKSQPPPKNAKKVVKKKKAEKKNNGGGKKILIGTAIAVLVLCAAFFAMGAYANGLETIFPKVSMEGTALGGLTVSEAAEALSKGTLGEVEDRELLISLPADCEIVLSAKEAGFFMPAPEAAAFAYKSCHSKGFFGNTGTYIKALTSGIELKTSDGAKPNETYIRSKIHEGVRDANIALMEDDLEIGEDSISVVKGAGSVSINEDELFELIFEALKQGDYLPIRYTAEKPGNGAEAEIDLQELYDTVFREPENAEYDRETKQATEHVVGRSFDMELAQSIWDKAINGEMVVIPLILEEPEITTDKLNSMLFSDLLSQKGTGLGGSSAARVNNITKAAAAINGLVLNPGDEFSFNKTVGQRTASAGYQAAGAYSNGQVVSEVGGGICQVSSTLYYCTLMANLEIVERYCHYFGVNYLPAGLDATVSWPAPDFRFKNNSDYPIKIEAGIDTSAYTVYIKIYGSNPDGIRVEMTTETWATANGYGAVSYRWVYDKDGNLISKKEEAKSQYHYQKEAEESPSPSPSEEPSPSPSESPVVPTPTPSPTPTPPEPTAPVEPTPLPDPVNPEA
ncbi:MAG: VanW family protein [Clostridiales bacterium]|nr:VanW family protein [Clostridiales bacterium]